MSIDRKRLDRLITTYGRAAAAYGVSSRLTTPSRALLVSYVMEASALPEFDPYCTRGFNDVCSCVDCAAKPARGGR